MVFALSAAVIQAAQAEDEVSNQDEIVLKNGSRIVGTITGTRDGVVTLETDFAGTLSVSLDQVQSLQSPEAVVALMTDDTVIEDMPLVVDNGVLVAGANQTYPLENLAVVNPAPWELGQGYQWTGLLNFALAMERGNTDTDELDYKLESVWLSTRDRYTLQFNGEIDEANGEKNADNWALRGKWDYFLTDPNYWGIQAFAEKDKFADLDLRYLVGPYIGRQIFADPLFTLSAEIGASYVNEEFNIAPDDDYGAANWAFRATSDYLGGDSQLYFNQTGVWNLEETSDVIVNTTLGLSFPLLWNFEAAAEVLWEYDSGAVDNVDDMDETYRIRIGYTW